MVSGLPGQVGHSAPKPVVILRVESDFEPDPAPTLIPDMVANHVKESQDRL